MDNLKFFLSWVLILVICSGLTDAACGSSCLNNTSDSAAPACNETTGECLYGCIDGYTGLQCQIPCGDNCLNCIVSPESENETECIQCALNYFKYGSGCNVCNNNCQGNTSSNVSVCNHNNGSCLVGCTNRYYGDKCDRKCEHLCVNSECHRDGSCSRGCRFMFYGPRCKAACSAGCVDNNINDVPNCHQNGTCKGGCVPHFWGPTCVDCNGNCVGDKSKTEEICRESDGFCVQGCKAEKFGITCSDDCPENCGDNLCNQINGKCLNKCNKGFYGEYCNNTCSVNCLVQGDICFSENGTCVAEECAVSWYGPPCEDRCPGNCMNEVCDRNSGFCSDGCVAGYFGNTCKTSCLKGSYGPNCTTNCSEGCVNSTCSPEDGKCSECVESFIGAKCDTKESLPPENVTEGYIRNSFAFFSPSALGVGVFLSLAVTLVLFRQI